MLFCLSVYTLTDLQHLPNVRFRDIAAVRLWAQKLMLVGLVLVIRQYLILAIIGENSRSAFQQYATDGKEMLANSRTFFLVILTLYVLMFLAIVFGNGETLFRTFIQILIPLSLLLLCFVYDWRKRTSFASAYRRFLIASLLAMIPAFVLYSLRFA